MHAELMKIFWGLVIIAVDIRFDDLDLLMPDIIGYALVYSALTRLRSVNAEFGKALPYTAAAGILWILSIPRVIPEPIASIAAILLDLGITWSICTGILQLAAERANGNLAHVAAVRRSWFGAISVTHVFVALFARSLEPVLLVALVGLSLLTGLFVLLLVRRASLEIV